MGFWAILALHLVVPGSGCRALRVSRPRPAIPHHLHTADSMAPAQKRSGGRRGPRPSGPRRPVNDIPDVANDPPLDLPPEGSEASLRIGQLKEMTHPVADAGGPGSRRDRRHRPAQAGADLPDPQGADRAERLHLLRGRPRGAARRLRVPARARLQLPRGPRRHLRLALADPQVRLADRRHGQRPDPAAQGRRALLRPDQGRGRQLRGPRVRPQQDLLREPDAALSAGAVLARDLARTTSRPASST